MNIILLDAQCCDANGNIFGSAFTPELVATAGKVMAAAVLSPAQIMAAHGLTPKEYDHIEKQVLKPPCSTRCSVGRRDRAYDILGYRWAACR